MEENNAPIMMMPGARLLILTCAHSRPYGASPKTEAIARWEGYTSENRTGV